jgi:hypothetical protein
MDRLIVTGEPTPLPKRDEKGLENQIGDNNCFLNVVIQALWHLDSFRIKFTTMKRDHKHHDPCAFCALEVCEEKVEETLAFRSLRPISFKGHFHTIRIL